MSSEVNNPATELRVILKEDKDGNLAIEYQAYIVESQVTIDMRPSHVAGQLYAGALLILAEKYKLLKPTESASNSKQEKKRDKR